MAIRKSQIQFFNEKLHWLVDVDWYFRVLKGKKCAFLDSNYKIASIHGHKGQITTSMAIEQMFNKDMEILKRTYKKSIAFFFLYGLIKHSLKIRNYATY